MMVKRILVPIDGSKHATKALKFAIDLAIQSKARLVIANIIEPGPVPKELRHMAEVEHIVKMKPKKAVLFSASVPVGVNDEDARVNTQLQEFISGQVLENAKSLAKKRGLKKVILASEIGDPARQILKLANRHNVDLITMGNRGLGGLKGLLMGSVSDKVNHLAKVTCTVVR